MDAKPNLSKLAKHFSDEDAARTPAMSAAAKIVQPSLTIENVTLFGRLRELREGKPKDDDATSHFFGELLLDNGDVWHVKFKSKDADAAAGLWRKQVCVTGSAVYYRAATARLVVDRIGADDERDYEAAFHQLYGINRDLYGADLGQLIRELRGED